MSGTGGETPAPDQGRTQVPTVDAAALMAGVRGELDAMMTRMRDPYAAALHEANRPREEPCAHGISYCAECRRKRRWSWAQHVAARDFKPAEKARVTADEARFIGYRSMAALILSGFSR